MTDASDIPVQAWLSYRCADELASSRRDELEAVCKGQGISLVYDEKGVQEGEHLIEFMEDLSAARCVFIFLAPNYFESAYTLFELICIHERSDLNQRFVLPVRLTDDMVTYERTRAQQFWEHENNEAIRTELRRLLKTYWVIEDDSDAALWQRIDAAWQALVFPYLDTLRTALNDGNAEAVLENRVIDLKTEIKRVVEQAEDKLQCKVHEACCRILKNRHISLQPLVEALGADTGKEEGLVAYMLADCSIDKILDSLLKVSLQRERELANQQEAWEHYLLDIERFCGWLLIKSVDKVWWFQQELALVKGLDENITSAFALDTDAQAYAEVIISRNLLQQAQFKLDEYGDIVPASESHDVLLFDAVSQDASAIELLTPVFKDLRRSPEAPQNVTKLLQGISRTVKALSGSREGKPVYYLVTDQYLDLLQNQSWYQEMNRSLAGYLHFVCCRLPDKNYALHPCQGDPGMILEKVASLLRLRNPKEH